MRPLIIALTMIPTIIQAEVPRVATDIAPVHAMVATVMQDLGTPSLLIPPGASPHSYAMRPSEARGVAQADVVVWVGPLLTPWLTEPLEALAPNARKLSLLEAPGMAVMGFREGTGFGAHDHSDHEGHEDHDDHADHDEHADHDDHADEKDHDGHGHADHEEHAHEEHAEHDGDDDHKAHDHDEEEHDGHADHAGDVLDPHIWLDPANGAAALDAIAATLSEMDPENAATYQANADAGKARLTALTDEITAMLHPARGKPFVVFHDAYHYFEARFDVEAVAAVSAGDAAAPGAARVSALREHIGETGAVCAFAEPQMNTKLLQAITEGQETRLSIFDPLGATLEPGPTLYEEVLRAMATNAADCLIP